MRGCLIGCTRCFFKPQHKDFRQHGRAPWLLWRFVGGVALAVQIVGSSGNTLVRHPHPELPSCGRPKDRSSARRPIHSWPPLRRGLSCWNDPARPELSCCGSPSSANTRYTLCLLAPLRRGLFLSNHLGTISRVPGFLWCGRTGEPSASSE